MGGNRITIMRFDVPVGTADPQERIRQIHERTGKVRHEKSLVLTQYGLGPTIGSAVNVTLLTYVDVCTLGIGVDTNATPDHDVFMDSLVAGFDEVLALGVDHV
jgi:diacylglycerol O-acyltransferase